MSTATPSTLPTELLRKIVGFATDLDEELQIDHLHVQKVLFPSGQESMKAKCTISHVSRTFQDISYEFLYEAITLDGAKTCFALERTLDTSGRSPAKYTRSMDISCTIRPTGGRDMLRSIHSVLCKARGLVAFSFSIHHLVISFQRRD